MTRQELRERRDELNEKDRETLARLFAAAKCMRRRIVGDGYVFCGRGAARHGGRREILFCNSHREQ